MKAQRTLKAGDTCEGIVTRVENYGLFVDVDGVPGLLRIPELSCDRIQHPSDVADVGDCVRFKILNLNDNRPHEQFNGSIKALHPRPHSA